MNGYSGYGPHQGGNEPGKGAAAGSLICGILSIILWFAGLASILSVILGIVGLVLASNSKKAGYLGGIRTAGFVLSVIGLVLGALIFMACAACVGSLGCVSAFI